MYLKFKSIRIEPATHGKRMTRFKFSWNTSLIAWPYLLHAKSVNGRYAIVRYYCSNVRRRKHLRSSFVRKSNISVWHVYYPSLSAIFETRLIVRHSTLARLGHCHVDPHVKNIYGALGICDKRQRRRADEFPGNRNTKCMMQNGEIWPPSPSKNFL